MEERETREMRETREAREDREAREAREARGGAVLTCISGIGMLPEKKEVFIKEDKETGKQTAFIPDGGMPSFFFLFPLSFPPLSSFLFPLSFPALSSSSLLLPTPSLFLPQPSPSSSSLPPLLPLLRPSPTKTPARKNTKHTSINQDKRHCRNFLFPEI
jgi:hypothetical protein